MKTALYDLTFSRVTIVQIVYLKINAYLTKG
jgi:hypothetical protein